jgi:pimeloyl-ACP methyl ester carboxylesterase
MTRPHPTADQTGLARPAANPGAAPLAPDDVDVEAWGQGPPVVLVHGSAGGSRQWHQLATRLSARHRVLAPNLRGYGGTPAWQGLRPQTLDDAAAVVLACCAGLDGPIRLVGHSYGGAVALWAARALGHRLAAVAVYEPMLPGLLQPPQQPAAVAEIAALHADVCRHGGASDWLALAERFVDYFGGDGSWAASPATRRAALAVALRPNLHEWPAVMAPQPADVFAGLGGRCLLLCGTHTRPALRAMAEALARQHPHWRFEQLPGCGHLAPVVQAEVVNERLIAFLRDTDDICDDAAAPAAA